MTQPVAPMLEYGGVATQHGVICEQRGDGVMIALPGNLASYIRGSEHQLVALARIIIWIARRLMRYPEPPRMIIELNSTELRITERHGRKDISRTWPRAQVGELRANRYSRGLLVRIPGKNNFDILGDCKPELVKWIGETLTAALEKTQPNSEV